MSESFTNLKIDGRLIKSLLHQKIRAPTPIQSRLFAPLLGQKDICAQARTGSGKTLAYLLPVIHRFLAAEEKSDAEKGVAVVLVPTKELAQQVSFVARKLLKASKGNEVRVTNLVKTSNYTADSNSAAQILVGTPSRLLHAATQDVQLQLSNVETVIFDEADMMLSFGYEDDVRKLVQYLPAYYQTVLMSATLSKDLEKLKELLLNDPVEINLEDIESKAILKQLYIRAKTREDRFLLTYILLKLKLPARSKTLIFANSVDSAYKLRLYLEQFALRSCVLNADMPVNSRYHTLQDFNRGAIHVMIATDVKDEAGADQSSVKATVGKENGGFTVARGIDFKAVNTVINFDLPASADEYTHRIGRTARGESNGLAISFLTSAEKETAQWQSIEDAQREKGFALEEYRISDDTRKSLEYRAEDALRSVTSLLVRQAKTSDIKKEILNSEKLKTYFEENPQDLRAVQHDLPTVGGAKVTGGSLKSLPKYATADANNVINTNGGNAEDVLGRISFHKKGHKQRNLKMKGIKRKVDPMKNLTFANKRKK